MRKRSHLIHFLDNYMEKDKLATDLFIESVLKPDHELRQAARDQGCLDELLQIRQDVLEYIYRTRS